MEMCIRDSYYILEVIFMGEVHYMISEAAKRVGVEAHVLRYWAVSYTHLNSIWRSGICTDHRRMPERTVYKSIRLVEVNVRADPHRFTYSRSGMRCV